MSVEPNSASPKPIQNASKGKVSATKKGRKEPSEQAPNDFMNVSLVKSLLLHASILAALLISFSFSSKPLLFATQNPVSAQPQPNIVQATFIDSNVVQEQKREQAQAQAQAAQKRRKEEARKQELERLRKKRVEDARKKKQQEEKQEQQRLEQEKLNALERERQKEQEIAIQRKKEEEMQRALTQEMEQQLKQEQEALAGAQQQRIMGELEKYQGLITQTIMRNLNTDGGFKGKSCTLNVKLASNGLVTQVTAIEGDDALCRAARTAVLRPSTLPVSDDPLVFEKMKNLNLIVRPDL